jgi:hypothetical protein
MRPLRGVFTLLFPLSCVAFAQTWEVGAAAGYGLYREANVTGATASGKTGFESGVAVGAVLGNDRFRYIGGDVRYTYRHDALKVSSGGVTATAGAQSHALHYDVLIHAAPREARVRPYLAVGAGVKLFRGTGAEPAYQPLSNLVVLTHTSQAEPLISGGAGLKIALKHGALLRFDFRDYATPVPDKLLATPPRARVSGWLHDFVFLIGVSTTF